MLLLATCSNINVLIAATSLRDARAMLFIDYCFAFAEKNKKTELQIGAQRRGVKKNLRKAKHEQFLQSNINWVVCHCIFIEIILVFRIHDLGWQGFATSFIEAGRAQNKKRIWKGRRGREFKTAQKPQQDWRRGFGECREG
jgi:hypothetical protein